MEERRRGRTWMEIHNSNVGIPAWKCASCGHLNPRGAAACFGDNQPMTPGLDMPVVQAGSLGFWIGMVMATVVVLFALHLGGFF